MEIKYDIQQFNWNKEQNSFHAEAWNLLGVMPDGTIHPEAFPSQREQFFIHNYKTDGFRRFRFVKELELIDEQNENFVETDWLFESEDGIKCYVCVGLN